MFYADRVEALCLPVCKLYLSCFSEASRLYYDLPQLYLCCISAVSRLYLCCCITAVSRLYLGCRRLEEHELAKEVATREKQQADKLLSRCSIRAAGKAPKSTPTAGKSKTTADTPKPTWKSLVERRKDKFQLMLGQLEVAIRRCLLGT